jgi:hypothetical protein
VSLKVICGIVGAILVVAVGKWLARRAETHRKDVVDLGEGREPRTPH